ncbi:hypothetical protein QE152_g40900 [Popillia japonica]|uniref:Uncharacterized protein n=1 Tax=Popillia japonica TaxID=7064 RepID=A0AAW1HF23_POPJA
MISCLDENNEFNFSLLDGILAINTAWNRVSQKATVNCYKHAGFYPYSEFDDDDELPSTQWILKHKDSEAVDKDSLTLHNWAITTDFLKGFLNLEIFNAFQEVDDDLLTC